MGPRAGPSGCGTGRWSEGDRCRPPWPCTGWPAHWQRAARRCRGCHRGWCCRATYPSSRPTPRSVRRMGPPLLRIRSSPRSSRWRRSSSSRCRAGPRWCRCSTRWTRPPARRWGHRSHSCTARGRWSSRCCRSGQDPVQRGKWRHRRWRWRSEPIPRRTASRSPRRSPRRAAAWCGIFPVEQIGCADRSAVETCRSPHSGDGRLRVTVRYRWASGCCRRADVGRRKPTCRQRMWGDWRENPSPHGPCPFSPGRWSGPAAARRRGHADATATGPGSSFRGPRRRGTRVGGRSATGRRPPRSGRGNAPSGPLRCH